MWVVCVCVVCGVCSVCGVGSMCDGCMCVCVCVVWVVCVVCVCVCVHARVCVRERREFGGNCITWNECLQTLSIPCCGHSKSHQTLNHLSVEVR